MSEPPSGLVFGVTRYPSKLGQPRDQANVTKLLRDRFDRAAMDWATSHTFRRTVATFLDKAGMSLAEISNQLGHADVPPPPGTWAVGRDLTKRD